MPNDNPKPRMLKELFTMEEFDKIAEFLMLKVGDADAMVRKFQGIHHTKRDDWDRKSLEYYKNVRGGFKHALSQVRQILQGSENATSRTDRKIEEPT